MAGDTFRRYELKYKVPNTVLPAFLDDLLEYMEIDEYSKKTGYYLITNIYYDTPDDTLIRTSLAKPTYKEKLRLRSYGVPNRKTKCFIEIKKKYKGLVSKRRIMAPLERADAYLAGQDDLENVQSDRKDHPDGEGSGGRIPGTVDGHDEGIRGSRTR